jgi:DHA2 family multidrug resistance protein
MSHRVITRTAWHLLLLGVLVVACSSSGALPKETDAETGRSDHRSVALRCDRRVPRTHMKSNGSICFVLWDHQATLRFINVPVGIASLALSRRIVTDPPHLQQARLNRKPIDWPGLLLIVTGLASLEVVLDKGQDQDWFASWWIVALSTIAASALLSLVIWELRAAAPIVEMRLFMRRNFATASALMLVFGAMLFASTVLLPEYLQNLMGYSAQQAGMALTPGGVVVLALLPVVAKLVPRLDARLLLTFGLVVTSAALLYITHGISPQMDFATAKEVRALQSVGLAFLFVPVQTMAYLGVPMQSSNQVSGIINLARYLGGGIGIALVTTLISRRAQFHQARLLIHSSSHADAIRQHGRTLARAFEVAGASSGGAVRRSAAAAYHEVLHQATDLAYLDAFWALGVVMAAAIPVVWLASRQMVPSPPGGRPGEQPARAIARQ